tara:strand:+ start:169 stop:510 length:342 start_codon:yes stop_codon:yes gene_type:complete
MELSDVKSFCLPPIFAFDSIITDYCANGFQYKKESHNTFTLTDKYNRLNVFQIKIKFFTFHYTEYDFIYELTIPLNNCAFVTKFPDKRVNEAVKFFGSHLQMYNTGIESKNFF